MFSEPSVPDVSGLRRLPVGGTSRPSPPRLPVWYTSRCIHWRWFSFDTSVLGKDRKCAARYFRSRSTWPRPGWLTGQVDFDKRIGRVDEGVDYRCFPERGVQDLLNVCGGIRGLDRTLRPLAMRPLRFPVRSLRGGNWPSRVGAAAAAMMPLTACIIILSPTPDRNQVPVPAVVCIEGSMRSQDDRLCRRRQWFPRTPARRPACIGFAPW